MPSTPEIDDDQLEALFKAVGFVVISWGQAEQSLDLAVAVLYQDLGGKPLARRLPKMLETKLEFVEKCLKHIPSLAPLQQEGTDLVNNFRSLAAQRHNLIHGAISSVAITGGGFSFTKLDIKNDKHEVREFRFEGTAFPGLSEDLVQLGSRSADFGHRLLAVAHR